MHVSVREIQYEYEYNINVLKENVLNIIQYKEMFNFGIVKRSPITNCLIFP